MNSKKKLLQNARLYGVIDKETLANSAFSSQVLRARGAAPDIVQARDKASSRKIILKEAESLCASLSAAKTLRVVNDYADIALLARADGVHIGQDDLPVEKVRKLVGDKMIIGVSCHTLRQALDAEERGADYISVGPVFATPTKPEYKAVGLGLVAACSKRITIPFFAIGGIDLKNIGEVLAAGAVRVAVCRALLGSADIRATVANFRKILHDAARIRKTK